VLDQFGKKSNTRLRGLAYAELDDAVPGIEAQERKFDAEFGRFFSTKNKDVKSC
jgi:hypothetical protein